MNWPILSHDDGENSPNSSWLDNRAESLTIIDAGMLGETTENPPCFVSIQRTIWLKLMMKNPFACNNISTGRTSNEIPSFIILERSEFVHRSRIIVRILESTVIAFGIGLRTSAMRLRHSTGLDKPRFPCVYMVCELSASGGPTGARVTGEGGGGGVGVGGMGGSVTRV
jgi:hypothetical protein